jgi:creatinine amidohydrolase
VLTGRSSLADLTWQDAELHASHSILAIPVGATEQHGPHLPLSTDTDIAVALAQSLSKQRSDTFVAPAIAYGSSGEHSAFAGTLSVGQDATELLLVELGRSASDSFSRTLFICAHGGNHEPVSRAEQRLRSEARSVRSFSPSWPGDAHAGRVETSLMLALHPERVHGDRAVAGATAPLETFLPTLRDSGVRAVSENGVLGDPTGASADEGRSLICEALGQLIALVESWDADT